MPHTPWSEVKAKGAHLVVRGLIQHEADWRQRVGDADYERSLRNWRAIAAQAAGGDLSPMVVFEPAAGDCWVCGIPAHYLDLSFEAPVCGGICVWAAWEALRLHDTPWRAW